MITFEEYSKRMREINRMFMDGNPHSCFADYIAEGIVVNYVDNTVSLNDTDDGVVFLENEHLVYRYKNLKVYSLLKRTPLKNEIGKNIDGNPFTHALKKKYGWTFKITQAEINKYVKKFLSACNSLNPHYDIIVSCPSHSDVNKRFMRVLAKRVHADKIIEDYFKKTEKQYILDFGRDFEQIRKDHPDTYEKVEQQIYADIMKMGKYFEAGKMNKKHLKYIKNIVSLSGKYTEKNALELFGGKRVLVLDDVLSSGATVSECVRVIQQYAPTSIDVITLLSKRYKK